MARPGVFANVQITGATGEEADAMRSIAEAAIARAEQILAQSDGYAERVAVNVVVDTLRVGTSIEAIAAEIVRATLAAAKGSGLRFSQLFARQDYAQAIARGGLLGGGPVTLSFDNGKSYPLTDFVGAGGNTVIYGTRYQNRPAALRLINNKADEAAVLAAREFAHGAEVLARNGIPVVEVYDSASRMTGDGEIFDYTVTERIPEQVMKHEKLGTYFEELGRMDDTASAAERRSAKYQAFLEFVRLTAGLKKIGDFSPDHIVYHEGRWLVYDLSANHKPVTDAGEEREFNPRSTVWAKLYSVPDYKRGESSEHDLIDPRTIADINAAIQEARAGGIPEWVV